MPPVDREMAKLAPDSNPQDATLTRQLAGILGRTVDDDARRRASLHILDWTGCAIAGAVSPAGTILTRDGPAMFGAGPCRVVGGAWSTAAGAAFVNGGLGNILEMDDVHRTAILHPGSVVVPAALAVCQRLAAGAGDLLDAVVRGYEAMIRLGRAVGPGHYAFWHNTATCGPFGAAAAAGSLLALDTDGLVSALGNAGTQAGGLWQCRHEDVMAKQWHTGRAAEAGVLAADLARLSFTGPATILDGPQGFFAAMCPDGEPAAVTRDAKDQWLIHETSFKPWPACRHTHAAIDAALAVRARAGAQRIESVNIETFGDAMRFCDNAAPETTLQAKFSLQHAVAVTLLDGPPPLESFDPPVIHRAELVRLRGKTAVRIDPSFDAAYPAHFGSRVAILLADGRTETEEACDALGDPENPVSMTLLQHKAETLMRAANAPDDRIEQIVAAALALPTGGPLDAFVEALP